MAYNIKLFVHGVPNGQDIWGNPGADIKYIEAFYRKSNVASQMILEVMQFGGETNAYYTYFYSNDKIQDEQYRNGGYFALTLRINYYYADIQNIYNLLEAAFNKYIIGSVLEYTTGGGCRFKISQFKQVNDNLNALEKELIRYLMQFSSDKDFMPLGGFKSNGLNEIGSINLLEAIPEVVANHVKSTSKISVSSLYTTSKEQQIINKMNSKLQTTISNAQQQIAAIQQKAQQDVQAAQRDKEQGILAVKNEYKDADKTISQLHAQIDKNNKEITRLNAQVNDLNTKLQNAQVYKTHYEENKKELEKTKNLIAEIKKNLSGLSGISELLGIPPGIYGRGRGGSGELEVQSNGIVYFVKKIHPFLDFFVMVILLIIIGVTLPKSFNNKDKSLSSSSLYSSDKKEVVEQKETDITEEDASIGEITDDKDELKSTNVPIVKQEKSDSLRAKYTRAKIDASNINEGAENLCKKLQ